MNDRVKEAATEYQAVISIEEVMDYLIRRGLCDGKDALIVLEGLLQLGTRSGRARLSVSRAAAMMYVSRRTLGRWCDRGGLPNPSKIIALGRILVTMRVLHMSGCSIARAATMTSWPDPFTFSNAMHRLTGLRPSVARTRGLVFIVEAWLQRGVATGEIAIREAVSPLCPNCGRSIEIESDSHRQPLLS